KPSTTRRRPSGVSAPFKYETACWHVRDANGAANIHLSAVSGGARSAPRPISETLHNALFSGISLLSNVLYTSDVEDVRWSREATITDWTRSVSVPRSSSRSFILASTPGLTRTRPLPTFLGPPQASSPSPL